MSLAALEAALAAAPDDPLVLAAYADCLSDAGDPRGEFVRLQMALDDPASGLDRRKGLRAIKKLWEADKAAWAPPKQLGNFRIGFYHLDGAVPLARIRLLASFTTDALTASPVWWLLRGVHVVLFAPNADVPDLFARLARSRVHTLRFDGRFFHQSHLDDLLASPLYPRLTELHLPGCRITDDRAEALAAHPHTPRLRPLDLDRNHLSPIGHGALAAVGVDVSDRQYFMPGGWDFDPPAFPDPD